MSIRVVPANALPSEQRDAWRTLLRENPALDSPYLRPEFIEAVAAFRPNVCVGVVYQDDAAAAFLPFEQHRFGRGTPVGGPLSGCQALIAREDFECDIAEIVRRCGLRVWDFDHLLASQSQFHPFQMASDPAVYVDLGQGFDEYCKARRRTGSDRIPKVLSRARKLQRECGQLEFEFHSASRSALHTMAAWKSAQFRETGFADIFRYDWTLRLLEHLLDKPSEGFSAVLSVLSIEGTPIGVSFALRSHSVLHGSLMAFDRSYAKYSPGSIMLLRLAEAAAQNGIRRFDLGKGDQQYKRSLMSGTRTLVEGAVTCRPLTLAMRRGWFATRDLMRTTALRRPAESSLRWIRPVRGWCQHG